MADRPTVIVHFDEDAEINYFVAGEGIRLLIVDDRTPHDRVYEWLTRATPEQMAALIPADTTIGHSQDERHAAFSHAIKAAQRGERHLTVVPAEEPK